MTPAAATAPALVAIAGNPNVGKTSVFNRLTGLDLKVTNYPGVTVERQEGRLDLGPHLQARILDVPGTYSLSSRSAEEQIAISAITGIPPYERPDLVIMVIDATQLSRNLYLLLQVLETKVPTVVALNMMDVVQRRRQRIDVRRLEAEIGVPVVEVSGNRGTGIDTLRATVVEVLSHPDRGIPGWRWRPEHPALLEDIDRVGRAFPESWSGGDPERAWAWGMWALLSVDESDELEGIPETVRREVLDRIRRAEAEGRQIETEVIQGRYEWIDEHITGLLSGDLESKTRTEHFDSVLLHPAWGFALFLLVMAIVFQSLFSWANPLIDGIDGAFSWLGTGIEGHLGPSLFRDFLVNGVIAGVGSVVVFLPQILLLFFLIGMMEDSGYMARVAFLMDRIMKRLGLHGRAFVPMLSGYACAVPAIMATRTMERRRDRMVTMMVIPLMTCSARLPVYTLLIAALFPPRRIAGIFGVQSGLMVAMYLFSTVVALIAAGVLGRFVFKGQNVPLLMELPPYRVPHWGSVVRMMWQRASLFLNEAGRVILLCTIGLWILLSFPRHPVLDVDYDALRTEVGANPDSNARTLALGELDARESSDRFLRSYGARLGHFIEPVIEPLGFDWKVGIGLIGAFAAREVFISTLGVVYGIESGVDEHSSTLREKIRAEVRADGSPLYTPLMGLSLMIFFALSCQCMSTLAAVYRETKTIRWPLFLFAYMTTLAWTVSFAVYQGGLLLGLR